MLWWLVRDDYDPVMVVKRHTRKEAATVRIAAFAVTATACEHSILATAPANASARVASA